MSAIQSIVNMQQVHCAHHNTCSWRAVSPGTSKPLKLCFQMVSTKRLEDTACIHDASTAHDVDIEYSFDKPSEIIDIRMENHRNIITGLPGVIDGVLPASRADLIEFTDRARVA
eukprot:5815869-Pyramimonas_sp.AAC.1